MNLNDSLEEERMNEQTLLSKGKELSAQAPLTCLDKIITFRKTATEKRSDKIIQIKHWIEQMFLKLSTLSSWSLLVTLACVTGSRLVSAASKSFSP